VNPWDVRMIVQDVLFYGVVLVVLIGAFRLLKTYVERRGASPKELREVADRLARIEQATDAMAIEVERVSEAQRFAARLLNEQQAASADRPRTALPSSTNE
jgi:hypothetical protein